MTGPRALRIGDAERDVAVSALGEHFAAGRITKEEFDERSGQASAARFAADLDHLFDDLPQPVAVRSEPPPVPRAVRRRPGPWLFFVVPLAMMMIGGLLFLIASVAPWLLFVVLMLFLFGGPGRRRHWHHHHHGGWGPPGRGEWQRAARPDRDARWAPRSSTGRTAGRPVAADFGRWPSSGETA